MRCLVVRFGVLLKSIAFKPYGFLLLAHGLRTHEAGITRRSSSKCGKADIAGVAEFLKPLNEVVIKANKLTEGKRTEYFNHLKSTADSLTALAWVAYLGKDCGMSMPLAHVEESWQMAEFDNNKFMFCRWAVENQVGKNNLVIDDCVSKQSVYVFGSTDTVLQVKVERALPQQFVHTSKDGQFTTSPVTHSGG